MFLSLSKGGLFKTGADLEFLLKSVFVLDLIKMEVQSLNILRARHSIEKQISPPAGISRPN